MKKLAKANDNTAVLVTLDELTTITGFTEAELKREIREGNLEAAGTFAPKVGKPVDLFANPQWNLR